MCGSAALLLYEVDASDNKKIGEILNARARGMYMLLSLKQFCGMEASSRVKSSALYRLFKQSLALVLALYRRKTYCLICSAYCCPLGSGEDRDVYKKA